MSETLLSLPVVLSEVLGIVLVSLYAIRSRQHRILAAQLSKQRSIREFLNRVQPEQLEEMLQKGGGREALWRLLEDPRSVDQIRAEELGGATKKTVIGGLMVMVALGLKIAIDGSLMMFVAGIPFELILGVIGIVLFGLGVGDFVKVFLLAKASH